uniref:dispanin subfamily A member 2b-like n=1 Tax=Pristiophorus japonicus TaxID=55135 RepID=UPI00398EB53F
MEFGFRTSLRPYLPSPKPRVSEQNYLVLWCESSMAYRADQVPMNPPAYPYQEPKEDGQMLATTVVPDVLPVRDHLPWSIFNFAFMNFCCLGFLALVFSVKSRDRKVVGDVEGARHYASTARSLNIATTVLSILVFIILIAAVIVPYIMLINALRNQHRMY